MVGREENTVKTLLRIEAIIIQGILMGLLLFAIGVALIPFVPFSVVHKRWKAHRGDRRTFRRVLNSPFWFVSGCLYALLSPIGILWKTVSDLRTVVAVEWAMRMLEDEPKKPNGHPLELPTPDERARRALAHTMGVIRDYNGEARTCGQGLPIDETRL